MLVFIFQDNQETEDTPKYKITFYVNQEVVKEVESSGYEIIVAPSPLNIDGYTFVGWFFDENTWQDEYYDEYFISKPLTNDVNVYAYYNEIQVEYKIYFNVDNENIEFIETAGNEIITLPSPPIKEGYTFKGWYFDNNIWNNELTTDYYANEKLSQDITVYAYYEEDVILPTVYSFI